MRVFDTVPDTSPPWTDSYSAKSPNSGEANHLLFMSPEAFTNGNNYTWWAIKPPLFVFGEFTGQQLERIRACNAPASENKRAPRGSSVKQIQRCSLVDLLSFIHFTESFIPRPSLQEGWVSLSWQRKARERQVKEGNAQINIPRSARLRSKLRVKARYGGSWREGMDAHHVQPGSRRVDTDTTMTLFLISNRVFTWGCAALLPPRWTSSPLRTRTRPRTKWESSRFSSRIPGAPLSSCASLLLLLPSPWLCPRIPPLRSPPVISRLVLRLFTGGNSPCAPVSSRLPWLTASPSPSLAPCVVSRCLPVRQSRRAIGFLRLTSDHCADSLWSSGTAGDAWLQYSADAGWSVGPGVSEEEKEGGEGWWMLLQ